MSTLNQNPNPVKLTPNEFSALETIARYEDAGSPCHQSTSPAGKSIENVLFLAGLVTLKAVDLYHDEWQLLVLTQAGRDYFANRNHEMHPAFLKELRAVERECNRRDGVFFPYLIEGKNYTERIHGLRKLGYVNTKPIIGYLWEVSITDVGYVALGMAVSRD